MSWLDTLPAHKLSSALERYRTDPSALVTEIRERTDDERFGLWWALCNAHMVRTVGVGVFDVADWHWHDAFADDMSPHAAVREALAADGF